VDQILLDTDVILDFFFNRKPFADDTAKILRWCELKEIAGLITPVIVSNAYYLLRKNSTAGKVIEKLKELMTIIDVITMDREIIMNALHSDFNDFEDALQHFSAVKSRQVDLRITRNVKDYKLSTLPVFTPESYIRRKISNN
jgi:predicted nucleic acid-binding protein